MSTADDELHDPVKLPLGPEEALRALLAVDPESDPDPDEDEDSEAQSESGHAP